MTVVRPDISPLTFSYDVADEELSLEGEPLNATRAKIKDFSVMHNTIDDYIEVEFDIESRHVGPVRYYLHF